MEPSLSQIPTFNLMQKPQMQLALRVLQAPAYDLIPLLTQEVEENPLLEWEEPPLFKGLFSENLEAQTSLTDHLLAQLADKPPHTELLLGYLDKRGLIPTPLDEIARDHKVEIGELEKGLAILKALEPKGVCSASPKEALLIQLEKGAAYTLIQNHYEDLLNRRYRSIPFSPEEIERILEEEIACLNPHPGAGYAQEVSPIAIADLWIMESGEQLKAAVEEVPELRICLDYRNVENRYLKEKLEKANWILRTLKERKETLLRIGELLITSQKPFLKDPSQPLAPLTLTDAAFELCLANSTLSRAVANKTVSAPWGLIPLRAFFSHAAKEGVSAHEMKERLKGLIAKEDPKAPLTDEKLADHLGCARRTITKYRHKLGIGNRSQRRRYK